MLNPQPLASDAGRALLACPRRPWRIRDGTEDAPGHQAAGGESHCTG